MIRLMAFLGNCGEKYRRTRHNVAWQFADAFLPDAKWSQKFRADFASCERSALKAARPVFAEAGAKACDESQKIAFLKPLTLMNLSGEAVAEAASFYKIRPDEILVVHDELELPFGAASLKFSGGLAGHNGLRSTKACLGTADFWRFRFGIGRPEEGADIADYVLSDFRSEEASRFGEIFSQAAECVQSLVFFEPEAFLKSWAKRKLA